jgi:DNA-directed RNA polymerase subunit F
MWSRNKTAHRQYSKADDTETLPVCIYELKYDPMGALYLDKQKDLYEFPYKLYGSDSFPERVITTFKDTNANLGVILSGTKGTGKTVQAKQICNLSGLPVILVTSDYEQGRDLATYLNTINQDVVVMVDEYEKIFKQGNGLLSVMDGASASNYRRLFLLTMNSTLIADALLDRPSRVHYLKKFRNLDVAIIREIMDDLLEHKEFSEEIVEYLQSLAIVTIDIVKTVIQEVNRFRESPHHFKDILNISIAKSGQRWNIYDDNGVLLHENMYARNAMPPKKQSYLDFEDHNEYPTSFGYAEKVEEKGTKITNNKGQIYRIKPATVGFGLGHVL